MGDSMARENPVRDKSYAFALQVVETVRMLQQQREFVLSNQLLRAGTSVGANIEEASASHTKREFAAKMSIASREARESDYWLRLLSDSGYLSVDQATPLKRHCLELIRLLTAIVKTSTIKH
jgi:four helix bundle protein